MIQENIIISIRDQINSAIFIQRSCRHHRSQNFNISILLNHLFLFYKTFIHFLDWRFFRANLNLKIKRRRSSILPNRENWASWFIQSSSPWTRQSREFLIHLHQPPQWFLPSPPRSVCCQFLVEFLSRCLNYVILEMSVLRCVGVVPVVM